MNPEDNRNLLARLDRLAGESEEARLDAEAEAVAKRVERELRSRVPAEAVAAILPANADPLAPQDPVRRARFVEHLTAMVEAAVLDRGRYEVDLPSVELPANGREAISAAACAACRGGCCRAGGDHAYLTEETMARTLEAHPDWTLRKIVDVYVERLPARSTVNSCVYHGPTGCGLPRELRSPTCNTYFCGKLTQLRARLPQTQPPPVLALMFDHGRWARAALLDVTGPRILKE
ncbi:MAG TPA: hypothetical protein VF950_17770 [Planctomycetota bacterium]